MFGIGKPRTKIGKFIDKYGITQEWLVRKTGLGRNTIGRITGDKAYSPTLKTIKKIMKAIREVDPKAKADDFFDM
ncbi:MAG: helix-turn-helix domain-containing protein [Bacillota bacterium]